MARYAAFLRAINVGTGRYIHRPCNAKFWDAQRTRNRLAEPTPVIRSAS